MVGIRSAVLVGFLALPMCEPPPAPPVGVTLRVTTTQGRPVNGAEVRLRGSVTARSDEAGSARVVIGGKDGESFELHIQCPAPLRSPVRPLVVRRLDIKGGAVEHSVKCEETQRTLIVAVRADNGPDLPIVYLGNEIGRTDRSGAAHLKIDANIHERVELTLSTAQKKMKGVHPQNPVAVFEPADHDEIREFAVDFKSDPKKQGPKPAAPKGPQIF